MEFILDTNAYRNLVEEKNMGEVYGLSQELQKKEFANGDSSALSIVVAMELISRLGIGDVAQERCFKALCLQFFHTRKRVTGGGNEVKYYPPLNVILSQFFFSKNSKYHALYGKVIELTIELTKTMKIEKCDEFAKEIDIVKKQIQFENQEFQSNIEDLLRSLNGGKLDWQYFIKNKEEQKQFKAKIDDGRMEILLGLGLFKRAHQIVDIYGTSSKAASRLDVFFDTFKSALKINNSILASVADGSTWLADIDDSKWNTLNDFQIMFGLLYERPGIDKRLVTDEKKIRNACIKAGKGHLIITLNQYKTILGV